jgi:hypothetical protein
VYQYDISTLRRISDGTDEDVLHLIGERLPIRTRIQSQENSVQPDDKV